MFVTRQEREKGIVHDEEDADPHNFETLDTDPFQEQLPTLQQVITQFQEAKRVHEDLKDEAVQKQTKMKKKNSVYLIPILHPSYQVKKNCKLFENEKKLNKNILEIR